MLRNELLRCNNVLDEIHVKQKSLDKQRSVQLHECNEQIRSIKRHLQKTVDLKGLFKLYVGKNNPFIETFCSTEQNVMLYVGLHRKDPGWERDVTAKTSVWKPTPSSSEEICVVNALCAELMKEGFRLPRALASDGNTLCIRACR